MAQPIDYQAVLADLERRRRDFNQTVDAAISAIRRMLELSANLGAVVQGTAAAPMLPPLPLAVPMTLTPPSPAKPFDGVSLGAASIRHLGMSGQGLTNQEIADALHKAGFPHPPGSNFANLVGTALWREAQKDNPRVVREGRRWLLTEWGRRASA